MIGEVSVAGVFVPALLLLALGTLAITGGLTMLLRAGGFYRIVAYRPLVDLCLFILLLGLIVFLTSSDGIHA